MADSRTRAAPGREPRVLFLTTHAGFFASHWIGLARVLRTQGFEVVVGAARDASVTSIEQEGFLFRNVAFERFGMNPVRELATIAELVRLYADVRPSLAHHFGHKPVVYGAIAARITGVAAVGTVPGLGYAYVTSGAKARTAKAALRVLYRLFRVVNPTPLIFENCADRQLFLERGLVRGAETALVPGAGVDCQKFKPQPECEGDPVVVLAARMVRDKGVVEFVDAARRLAQRGIRARFVLAGAAGDGQRAGISEADLRAWSEEGIVTWIGQSADVPGLLARAHIVCLPSYVEGLPLSLAEAAAAGKPIVASDIPGCRAVVRDRVNGFLVPVKDSAALSDRIAELLADRELRQRMGALGRDFAVRELSIERCVERTFALYRKVGLGVQTSGPAVELTH